MIMKEDEKSLIKRFMRLEWLWRFQHMRGHGPLGDPHRGQGRVLALLKLNPEISQRDLAHILDIRAQSLGELLAKLERSGYITREPSEQDRRVMMVRLTDAGAEAAKAQESAAQGHELFGCLDDGEKQVFGAYLDRIIASLEDRIGPDADIDPREHFGKQFGRHGRDRRELFAEAFGFGRPGPDGRGPRGPRRPHHCADDGEDVDK